MRALFAKGAAASSLLRFLDVRTKIVVIAATAVATLAASGLAAQLVLFAATLVYALFLKRAKLLAVLYALMAVMMAIAVGCAWGLQTWLPQMGELNIHALAIPFLRGLSMMNVVMVLALTTRVEDLLLLRNAEKRGLLPPFVNTGDVPEPNPLLLPDPPGMLTNDIKQVWETLRIKGWPLGPAMFTRHPILSARLILAPILFRALKSSETLGVAAELKGMGSRERTVLVDAKTMTSLDARVYSVLLLTLLFVAAAEVLLADLWMTADAVAMP